MTALTLPPPRAVLLDLDGTLIDSEPAHRATWRAFFAARGWEVDDTTYAEHFVGRRGADVFRTLPGPWAEEDPEALVEEVLSYLPQFVAEAAAVRGAVRMLCDLFELGVPVGVVTSATRAWAEHALGEVLGAWDLVRVIVAAEDVEEGKPDPTGYLAAAAALGADPAETVAFEDSPTGVRAARAAGVGTVVGVLSTSSEWALREAGAADVVPDLASVHWVDGGSLGRR